MSAELKVSQIPIFGDSHHICQTCQVHGKHSESTNISFWTSYFQLTGSNYSGLIRRIYRMGH